MYVHKNISIWWKFNLNFVFDLLYNAGVNLEKFNELLTILKVTHPFTLKNCSNVTTSLATNSQLILTIKRVYRVALALCYFAAEKNVLSDDEGLILFLLGYYLQLDSRFLDSNIIEFGRRLMANALKDLSPYCWNNKRNLIIECIFRSSSKNHYVIELLLKTHEKTIWLRTQLAYLHLKRLIQFADNVENRNEAAIVDDIISNRLEPKLYNDKQSDFIDIIKLLTEVIDSYQYEQQMIYIRKLYDKMLPFAIKTHEKLLKDEYHVSLFDYCTFWETRLRPVLTSTTTRHRMGV